MVIADITIWVSFILCSLLRRISHTLLMRFVGIHDPSETLS